MAKKQEKAKDASVLLVALLDRSGSMKSVKTDIEGAWKQLITEQREVPGELKVSLYQFDFGFAAGTNGMRFESVYEDRDVHEPGTETLVLEPRGLTPLYDAVATAITRTDDVLKNGSIAAAKAKGHTTRKKKVVLAIMTDGLENSSREYSLAAVRKMIEDRQEQDWSVLFLGAGLKEAAQAADMGVHASMTVDYMDISNSGQVVNSTSDYLARNRMAMHSGGQSAATWSAGLTQEELAAAQGKHAASSGEKEKKGDWK